MSARNPARSTFRAVAGFLGFSVLASILVTVMLTPGLAVTGAAASETMGVFEKLPESLKIGIQPQENKIVALNDAGEPVTLAKVYSQNREEVGWDEIAPDVMDAAVAGEDRRFYEHGGVDLQGLVRAVLKNAAGSKKSGASTLTMQLVKNIFIQQALQYETQDAVDDGIERAQAGTIDRKLKEMKLAIGLEKKYTKKEILLAYLNIAGFGNNTYGIQAAAERYYGVSAKELTLPQAASLIAIVQEPGKRSLNDPDHYAANKDRRNVILGAMYGEKMITKAEYDRAIATKVDDSTVKLAAPQNGCVAGYDSARQFCDFVVKSVKDLAALGDTEEERLANWKVGGYTIYTTLNLSLQDLAQSTLRTYAPPDETKLQLGASSVIVEVGTGKIRVMAQNKGFDDTKVGSGPTNTALNFNTDQPYGGSRGFQVGSTYKVFTLLNWLANGHGLMEVMDANERTVNKADFLDSCDGPYGGPWKVHNDQHEHGTRTVMAATAGSVNGAYVSMALKLDLCDTKKIAESLGMHPGLFKDDPISDWDDTKLRSVPASVLGSDDVAPMTIAAAYAALANAGTFCKPIFVEKVIDSSGKDLGGQKPECSPSLVDAEVAAGATYALQGAMNAYNANPHDGIPHMGKTGTTSSSKQTWVVNSSTAVTSVTWVGNIKGEYPIRNYRNAAGKGGDLRHKISRAIMLEADKYYGGGAFPAPPARLLTGTGITLDDLVGQSPEIAKSIIEARGLVYEDDGQVDSDRPAGQIAATDPAAGTVMASGMTVKVFTSNESMSAIPDVVSGHPAYGSAQSTLNGVGFDNVSQYCVVTADPLLLSKVVESDPAPGTVYRRDREVKLGVGAASC